jgi:putative membrane protein
MISALDTLVIPSGFQPARNLLLFLTPATLGKYAIYPVIDAVLNGTSAVLLFVGHRFILRGRMAAHRAFMLAALVSSSLFLISYLYYHVHVGSVHFQGQGWSRPLYFTILTSHTILAAVIVPMVIITLTHALREKFDRHRVIARWTYPLWMYVSVTGVIVYFMLYRWFA